MGYKILLVDDDALIAKCYKYYLLQSDQLEIEDFLHVSNIKGFKDVVDLKKWDLCISDLYLGKKPQGLEVVNICNKKDILCCIITGNINRTLIIRGVTAFSKNNLTITNIINFFNQSIVNKENQYDFNQSNRDILI